MTAPAASKADSRVFEGLAGVSDVRNSRAVKVMELLQQEGARVSFADPLVQSLRLGDDTLTAVTPDAPTLAEAALFVVLVRNAAWPVQQVLSVATPTFDAVNALGEKPHATHERL